MPIQLNDTTGVSKPLKNQYTPKFFSSKLTGSGKTTGILCQNNNPINIDPNAATSGYYSAKLKSYTHNNVAITQIPIAPIPYDMNNHRSKITAPQNITKIGEINYNGNTVPLYLDMSVDHVSIEEKLTDTIVNTTVTMPSNKKNIFITYTLKLYAEYDSNSDIYHIVNQCYHFNKSMNTVYIDTTRNPIVTLNAILTTLSNTFNTTLDTQAINNYMANYDIYTDVCKTSQDWQTHIDTIMSELINDLYDLTYNAHTLHEDTMINILSHQLVYLETYNVPLDMYRNMFTSIKNCFNNEPDIITKLCKQNLNLLLSNTLNNLNDNKINLQQIPVNNNNNFDLSRYSIEQRNAITSTEPLVLVQAGAGTGKSTVILGRIKYLIDAGVNPSDITVLSFTNAAANNIIKRTKMQNQPVNSMTIARMVHEIYSENFSNHALSSVDTIINSLDIYFNNDQIVIDFKHKLNNLINNTSSTNPFTELNNFVEDNYDDVIKILDTISQTCLELEIIICYQQIDTFKEPNTITSKYLIIDEVQDNSIFEFIYALKYIEKHNESLFIVGDCSQTLYEFRASNPKALNMLEGSGVFATYQLNINYRSTQPILDFANVVLSNIEANQYANIQLQANNLTPVTPQSFTDAVKLQYQQVHKLADIKDNIPSVMAINLAKYLDEKLNKGEQVAFLAYTRHDVALFEDSLRHLYPQKKIASLIPKKSYNSTIMSTMIKNYWNEIKFLPTNNICMTISNAILNKLPMLVKGDPQKSLPYVKNMLEKWRNENMNLINNWLAQVTINNMTLDEFKNLVKENMLSYEIKNNTIAASLLSMQNEQAKAEIEGADFILSTIHSAKGLEFDNVVILMRHENNMSEENKRMYYVALTRAMKSEYIIVYDRVVLPKIKTDYDTIVQALSNPQPTVAVVAEEQD